MSDEWETVRVVGTEEEAALLAGFLEESGIPCEVESLLFHQEPVNFGGLGEVRVKVPADRLAEADRVLDERDAAFEEGAPEADGGGDGDGGDGADPGA